LDVFFRGGRFVIEISEWRVGFSSSLINTQNLEVFEAPNCTKKIRDVNIEIYIEKETGDSGTPNPTDQVTWNHENMHSICHALSTNNILRTLEVSYWHYTSDFGKSIYSVGILEDMAIPSFFQYSRSFEKGCPCPPHVASG